MSCGKESHARLKGPLGPWWVEDKLLIRCSKESHHPAEWASGWAALENEKDTTLTAIRLGVKILQFLFGLQLPLTRKPWITFSNPCNKVRGTYIYKEVFLRLFVSLWYCIWEYNSKNLYSLHCFKTQNLHGTKNMDMFTQKSYKFVVKIGLY